MSKIISVGLKLGATLDNAFTSVLGNAGSTINRLGRTTEQLSQRQQRLGQIMSRALSHPTRNVQQLRSQYDRLGQSLERLRTRQTKLNAALAKQNTLTEKRQALGGDIIGTAAAFAANTALLKESVGRSATYQDSLRDGRIKGSLSADEETQVGKAIRDTIKSQQTTQDHLQLSSGVNQLLEGGTSLQEINGYTSLLGQSVTGLRISMDDGASTFLALRDMGVDSEDQMRMALDQLVWSGKQGGYGMANLFNAVGQLGDDIKKHKLGLDSLGDIAATLQIGDGIMGAENSMSGLKGWLDESSTDKRASAFATAYKSIKPNEEFDYQASMQKAVGDGYSKFEASLKIASGFLDDKLGSAGIKELEKYKGNQEKQSELMERFGLSEVFKDSNQLNMVLGYRQNKAEFDRVRGGGKANGESTGALQQVTDLRLDSPVEKFNLLGNSLKELSITIGEALLPPVISLVETIQPIIINVSEWISANPKLVVGIAGLITTIVGLKVATLGAAWGMNFFIKSPLNALNVALANSSSKLELFRSRMLLGSTTGTKFGTLFPALSKSVTTFGKTFASVGRMLLLSPVGLIIGVIAAGALLIYKYWQPIKAFFGGVFDGIAEAVTPIGEAFSEVFGPVGELFKPLVGWISQAWNWIARLFEPVNSTAEELEGARNAGKSFGKVIGQAVNIILFPLKAVLKLIGWVTDKIKNGFSWSPMETIKNIWNGVTGWFSSIWDSITGSTDSGLIDINSIIELWSPLSIFKRVFNKVLSWFGVELPVSFKGAGQALLDGLIGGITSKFTELKNSVTEMGSSVGGWFKEKLGIKSPSRVFIGFGENISEGAAIGIDNQSSLVNKAVLGLAAVTAVSLPSPSLAASDLLNRHADYIQAPNAETIRNQLSSNASSAMTVTFSPTIHVKGSSDVANQVNDAMKISFREFERLMKEYEHRKNRTTYKGIDS